MTNVVNKNYLNTNDKCDAGAGRFLWPALAFIVPAAIHAVAFAVLGVSPFGDRTKSMMVIDNFHQYSPFLSEFREILRNGGSLLYSWNDGLGANYWARYAYYLASPFNLLFVFFPAQSLPEFIVCLSLLRTGLSGLFFYKYAGEKLRGKISAGAEGAAFNPGAEGVTLVHGAEGATFNPGAEGVAFACMYAISAYALAYYWNIMWFDCIALLPLIALGAERVARGRRGALYCFALAAAMYTNYYIALIICIFAVVYFLAYYAAESGGSLKDFFVRSLKFALYSALAAGIAAVILLPTWSALSVSQSAGAKFPARLEFYYNAFEILSGHLFNVAPSVMSGKPNLYCGVAALILIPLYFMNRRFALREKVAYGILLAFMLLSCNINYLNFIWHGLHFPNSLPYRFTFLYIFVVAALCLKTFRNLDGVSRRAVLAAFAAPAAYALVLEKLGSDAAKPGVIYTSLIFIGLNAAIIAYCAGNAGSMGAGNTGGMDAGNTKRVQAAAIAMLLLTTAELTINAAFGISSAGAGQRDNYMKDLDEVRRAVGYLTQIGGKAYDAGAGVTGVNATGINAAETYGANKNATGINAAEEYGAGAEAYDFYRVEFLKDTVSNTPSLYGYRGASYFSSTAVLKVTDLMGKLGFRPSSAWYIYKGSTPVINSLLSLRYLLSKEDTYDNPLYPLVGEYNGIREYENPYSLPLGFFADADLLSLSVKQPNVFKIQNDFLARATGLGRELGDALRPVAVERKELRNAEITSQSGNLYNFKRINGSEPGYVNLVIRDLPVYPADDRHIGGGERRRADRRVDGWSVGDISAGDGEKPRLRPLYLYIESRQIDYVWYIKGDKSEGHNIKNYPYIIDTQYFGDADEIEISLKIEENMTGSFEINAYCFYEETFARAYDVLNSRPLVLDSFSDTKFSGNIFADREGILFTTVPYDRGWSVLLDGEMLPPDDIEKIGEGFIALRIGPGAHCVEFSFIPVNFVPGLLISLICLLTAIALSVFGRKFKLHYNDNQITTG